MATVVSELSLRFQTFFRSFAKVIGAQIIISAINTALTAAGAYVFAFGLIRADHLTHQHLMPQYFSPFAVWYLWAFLRGVTYIEGMTVSTASADNIKQVADAISAVLTFLMPAVYMSAVR